MPITLLLICFVSLLLIIKLHTGSNLKETLVKSVLIFSTILVLITEITSFFNILNFQSILFSWIGISILSTLYLLSKKEKISILLKLIKKNIYTKIYSLNKNEKLFSLVVLTILTLVFVQGIVYPPNNWDSMTYHMARIPNWISHQSVEHYPTHIFRQIYQPPFSEFSIMHFNILNCTDYFSNSVQFFFLIFSLFAILLITDLFGLNRQHKFIAIILTVTIPEVILQASSTQNDIVVSFFILSSFYYAVKSLEEGKFINYFFLGLSIGLGILTKGTAYIYLAPIILIFGIFVIIRVVKTNNYNFLWCSFITIIIITSVNAGHFCRNYNLSNNIIGVDKNESKKYSNHKISPQILISNVIKNIGLHMPPYPINKIYDKLAWKVHSLVGVNINDPDFNFASKKYKGSPSIPNHEDSASNPIHFFLIFSSFVLTCFSFQKSKKDSTKLLMYLIIIVMQFVLFCSYLKWQPWHTRLHTPLFMLSIPVICYAITLKNIYTRIFNKTIPIITLYALFIILFNGSRPFITTSTVTSEISILDNRDRKYFSNRLNLYEEYDAILKNISESNNKNVGLIIGDEDWEYPLFSQSLTKSINPVHIKTSNITKDIILKHDNIDCIISTTLNNEAIDYNGKKFYNLNPKNKVIWLYK